jgi:hypothetical protein
MQVKEILSFLQNYIEKGLISAKITALEILLQWTSDRIELGEECALFRGPVSLSVWPANGSMHTQRLVYQLF